VAKQQQSRVNDFVLKIANVNGTGSASANSLLMKAVFRMGIPVSGKNFFPSNIQGLPTWYEIRVSKDGYLGRSGDVDVMVAMNAQTYERDLKEVASGGVLIYDSTWPRDLFVCSFVEYGLGKQVSCGDNKLGRNFYCIPRIFKPTPSLLFHNNGDGTFTEVSNGTDIQKALGKALGVVATDINNDGRTDLFVANDTVQNFLFKNLGAGKWEEIGLPSEVGFSANGQPRSGMGVDAGDLDADGYQDLFVSNVDQEMYALYRNNHDESFSDTAHVHGVAEATRLMSGWGIKFFDFDNDGNLDLFLANSHPDDMIDSYGGNVKYKEPLLLFRHDGKQLRNISKEAGPVFEKTFPARGMAVGDFDNDGRVDVVVANNGEAPLILRNTSGEGNHWLGLRLEGTKCNRDAIGALLSWSVGGVKRSRLKTNGGSYLASHDPREVIGLGAATKVDWLEIKWPGPSTRVDRIENVPVDKYVRIVEGKGLVS
jgi:Pyruvate/2-oxoacid:ferredoxin oxidoreductase gamma subunit